MMPLLAGLVVVAVLLGVLAVLRALRVSPEGVAGWLVLAVLVLVWTSMTLPTKFSFLPPDMRLPDDFRLWLLILSNVAGVAACAFAFTRRLYWVIVPLLFFGTVLLFVWAWDGPPRMF